MKKTKSRKVISLFSGAGGMDLGFEKAGFEIAVGVEKDPSCCNTIRINRPTMNVIEGDITEIKTDRILAEGKMKPLEAALVIGGPPCQSFSLAGQRMGMNDSRGMLVMEFSRVVHEALPKAFVMENVEGMVSWEKGKAIEAILSELRKPVQYKGKEYRYEAKYQVLNSADYGVPQFRGRLFIVGNRLSKTFQFPEATHGNDGQLEPDLFGKKLMPYKTVWDALADLPPADEPSVTAKRVSQTIKGRIKKHGY